MTDILIPLSALRELPKMLTVEAAIDRIEWAFRHGAFDGLRATETARLSVPTAVEDAPATDADDAQPVARPKPETVIRPTGFKMHLGDRKSGWTAEENRKVVEMIRGDATRHQLFAAFPNRTAHSILNKASRTRIGLGLSDGDSVRSGARSSPIIGNLWTVDEETKLAELIRKGLTAAEMVDHMPGRNKGSIQNRVQRLRRADPTLPPAPLNFAPGERSHDEWTQDLDDKLTHGFDAGYAIADICASLGRSEKSVRGRAYRLGLSFSSRDRAHVKPPAEPVVEAEVPSVETASADIPPSDGIASAAVQVVEVIYSERYNEAPSEPELTQNTGLMGVLAAPVDFSHMAPPSGRVRDYLRHYEGAIDGNDRVKLWDVFTPATDYNLFSTCSRGVPIASIAEETGISQLDLGARMKALAPATLRDRRGIVTIDGMGIIAEGLRRYAQGERA